MLWVDKHRPSSFSNFEFHNDLVKKLRNIIHSEDFTHLLIHGPPGAGKKTLISALLQELFGPRAKNTKFENKQWEIPTSCRSNKLKFEYSMILSVYHVEINLSDIGYRDIYLIQSIIKEIAQSYRIKKVLTGQHCKPFNVLILNDVDYLSKEAQQSLRRTMEKYSSICRMIMSCENISRIINPVRSRCLSVRVPAPTYQEITHVLQKICDNEKSRLSESTIYEISKESERNLRRAILTLEVCSLERNRDHKEVLYTDWELHVRDISYDILKEQTPGQILKVRNKIYELIVNCIPPYAIISKLLSFLLPRLSEICKIKATYIAAQIENRIREGGKAVYHLEAFVANLMYIQHLFILKDSN